nr:MAG TPA: hypothetical protein [Caudoviricetes sp.]
MKLKKSNLDIFLSLFQSFYPHRDFLQDYYILYVL